MRYTDIAVVGGGLAGSIAAAMLGRAGISAILVDPHPMYPPDFRVEKLSGELQIERFRKTGLAEATLRSATHDKENWIARFGYLLDRRPSQQYGIMYDALVNSIRAQIPPDVESIYAKAVSISTTAERQKVVLSNGEEISARLVVLTNGLNVGLRHQLGIERRLVSACHSISIGFYLAPVGRPSFPFPALTYFSERASARTGYLTLFPIGNTMRANLFVYRETDDPWLRQMRRAPEATLNALLPRLRRLTGDFQITGDVKIRPADLHASFGLRRPRRGSGRRCLCDHLPRHRDRHRQGVHRRRAAVQRPYSGLARERGHGRGQDRGVLRRSRQDRLRCVVDREGL
jgi:2-polyprenyl-6-methoxyphenol hydroxylase-like FAD-dependent oxidoreductase